MTSFKEEMARMQAPEKTTYSNARVTARKKPKKKKVVDISGNQYHEIITNEPSQAKQRDKFIDLMTFTDAETAKANERALTEFTSWMQEQRQEMSSELITLNDTGTFSNLQLVLQDINGDLLDFEDRIEPFLAIINSVRTLQEKDLITDTIAEIAKQKEAVMVLDKKKQSKLELLSRLSSDILSTNDIIGYEQRNIERLERNRSWFGFGDITTSSKNAIAAFKASIDKGENSIEKYEVKLANVKNELEEITVKLAAAQSFGEMSKEKQILADMLNLNSDEHASKHSELIESATKFVNTTKERVGETLESSLGLSDHIGKLSDLSYNIRGRYSVLASAAEAAERNNSTMHAELKAQSESIDEGDQLGKLENEEKQRDLAKYISSLNDSVADTTMVLTDMTVASQRIETMQHANTAQIKKTRSIATSGIAGVADNLSSVLTSIGQTAIGQAGTAAMQSLRRMNNTTINLTKEQMLNQAKDRQDVNADLVRNLENLAGFGEVIELANQNTYDAVAQARELVGELRTTADSVKDTIAEGVEIASSVVTDNLG
jgi:hypothetical protein